MKDYFTGVYSILINQFIEANKHHDNYVKPEPLRDPRLLLNQTDTLHLLSRDCKVCTVTSEPACKAAVCTDAQVSGIREQQTERAVTVIQYKQPWDKGEGGEGAART